jgi:2-dehydro-3-deoxyphosphogluconate aldolase/(4S)-4-hydroxy-2-oxoglutarate aldolase
VLSVVVIERPADAVPLARALLAGGAAMLRAPAGPFADAKSCRTGGVDAAGAAESLRLPNVACVGGTWLAPTEAIAAREWAAVTALARQPQALR